jgi:biopolymer transport protein ExbD/biopolymer transport protein TolR
LIVAQTTADRLRTLRALWTLRSSEQRSPKNEVKSNINVTPLVDVVLVLLIIFMVVTPMIASGVAVDLPRTVHHGRKPDDGKDIIVSVTWDKRLYLGSQAIPRVADLSRAVSDEKRRFPEKMVFLKGDVRASYGTVREIMQALQGIGIEDIVLGTEEQTVKQ